MGVTTINELTAEGVEAFSRARREPDWMRDLRRQAFARFGELPLPRWDRTDPKTLDWEAVRPPSPADMVRAGDLGMDDLPQTLTRLAAGQADVGAFVLQRDVWANSRFMRDELRQAGLIVTDMETALREHPALVQRYFMRSVDADSDKFLALHAALWCGGVFVWVPEGLEVTLPVQFQLFAGPSGLDLFDHILVVAGRNSAVTFVEGSEGEDGEGQRLHCGMVEVFAE
ncbi:MAG TPA: hypothetical protein VF234_10995, partial [Limnochordia bacterium]